MSIPFIDTIYLEVCVLEVQTVINKINQTKSQLENLENNLLALQNKCVHAYVELGNYKQCKKCKKSKSLYY